MARNEWRGDPFASVDILTDEERDAALPYVERTGPNAGTVLDPVPGAATRNAMKLLAPQAERPGTVAFQPPGGGVIVVPRENVRGGVFAPTDKGWVGQGQIPLGPAPAAAVLPAAAPGDRAAAADRLAALGQWAVENGGRNSAWDGVPGKAAAAVPAAAAARTPPAVMRDTVPTAPMRGATVPVAPSVIAQREAQNREVDMQRGRIERGMAPGGIRSGPTSVWDRRVAGQIQQENAGRTQREFVTAEGDREAARKRMQPQGVAGAAGTAYWDGTKWTYKSKQEAAAGGKGQIAIDAEGRVTSTIAPEQPEPPPHWTEQIRNLAPMFKAMTGGDVDQGVLWQIQTMPETTEEQKARKTQAYNAVFKGADEASKKLMKDVLAGLLPATGGTVAPVNPAPAAAASTPPTGQAGAAPQKQPVAVKAPNGKVFTARK